MNTREPFTKADGLEYQRIDLARWSTVLQPEVMEAVAAKVAKANAALPASADGYYVTRGESIDEIVSNLAYKRAREQGLAP